MLKNILLILIAVFLVSSLFKNITEYQKNKRFYNTYKTEFENEKIKNSKLKMEIIKSADPNEIEKTIRNKLNLVKENEVAVIVPVPTAVPPPVTPTPQPVYRQWAQLFLQ